MTTYVINTDKVSMHYFSDDVYNTYIEAVNDYFKGIPTRIKFRRLEYDPLVEVTSSYFFDRSSPETIIPTMERAQYYSSKGKHLDVVEFSLEVIDFFREPPGSELYEEYTGEVVINKVHTFNVAAQIAAKNKDFSYIFPNNFKEVKP